MISLLRCRFSTGSSSIKSSGPQTIAIDWKYGARSKPVVVETSAVGKTKLKLLLNYKATRSDVFTAQGYAKRGICRRRVSVCLCVCHTPVLYQNGYT